MMSRAESSVFQTSSKAQSAAGFHPFFFSLFSDLSIENASAESQIQP
jgi:hypothetical protein